MSKISVLKAFDAYPPAYFLNGGKIDDANLADRTVYEKCYDQAMQDLSKKVSHWRHLKICIKYITT